MNKKEVNKISWKREGNKFAGSITIELADGRKLTEEEFKQILPELKSLCQKIDEVQFFSSLKDDAKRLKEKCEKL